MRSNLIIRHLFTLPRMSLKPTETGKQKNNVVKTTYSQDATRRYLEGGTIISFVSLRLIIGGIKLNAKIEKLRRLQR